MTSLTDIFKRNNSDRASSRRDGQYTSVRSQNVTRNPSQKTLSDNLFKRGRTMPGVTQQGLESADKHTLRAATPREKVRHLAHVRRTVMTSLGITLIVIIALAVLVQQFSATVHISSTERYSVLNYSAYVDTVQKYLNGHPLERLRFNLNQSELTKFIQADHPEVKSITQNGMDGFAATDFTIAMRKPVVSWDVGKRRYFVDADGVSFEKNVYDDPTVRIIDNSGVEYTPGTAIASERFLSFVGRVVALSLDKSFKVTEVIIPAGTTRQVQLKIQGYSYPVIMSIERGPTQQVEDMVRALGYLNSQGRSATYVDIRVKGKAFYRE